MSDYVKTEWQTGDIITAEKLNNIEDGIYNAPVPTGKITITENGEDIDVSAYATADVTVEGGSSDFSTAEVTIVNGSAETVMSTNCYAYYDENEAGEGSPAMCINAINVPAGETVVVKVPLYKGTAHWLNPLGNLTPVITGNITKNTSNYIITGDGTITIATSSH